MANNYTTVSENAKRLLQKNQYDKALKLWEDFLQNANDNDAANALNNLGDICARQKNTVIAIDHYLKASHAFEKAGFPLKAIAALKKIVKMDPNRAEVYLRLGDLNARRDMVGNAVEAYLKVAKLMVDQGIKAEALGMIKKICILDPVNTRHRLQLAAELFELGFSEQAVEETVNAVDLFIAKGNLEEAERYCRHLLDLNPDNQDAQYRLERIANWSAESQQGGGQFNPNASVEELFAELDGHMGGGAPAAPSAPEEAAPAMDPFADPSASQADPFADPSASQADPFAEQADPFAEQAAPAAPEEAALDLSGMLEGNSAEEPAAPEAPADAGFDISLDGPSDADEAAPAAPEGSEFEMPGLEGAGDDIEPAPAPAAEEAPAAPADDMSFSLDGALDLGGDAEPEPEPAVEEAPPGEISLDMDDAAGDAPADDMSISLDGIPGMEETPADTPDSAGPATPEPIEAATPPPADDGPINIEEAMGEADFYEKQNLREEATALYQKVLEQDPTHETAAEKLKHLEEYNNEQNFVDGIADEFTDWTSEVMDAAEDEVGLDLDEEKVDQLVGAFRKGISEEVTEDDSDTHYDLGVAYHEMGMVEEAIEELQLAIKGVSRYADSCVMLARCFTDMGKPGLAVGQLRKAVDRVGGDTDEWISLAYELGTALDANGEGDEAKRMYEQVYARDITFRDIAEKVQG